MTTGHAVRTPPALWLKLAAAAVAWVGLYQLNEHLWTWLFADVFGLDLASPVGGAVHFFFYDVAKLSLLLTGLMFVIGILRASFDLTRARAYLEGKGLFVGLVLAVVLGVVTPSARAARSPCSWGSWRRASRCRSP